MALFQKVFFQRKNRFAGVADWLMQMQCPRCGEVFEALKQGYIRKYCSRSCANARVVSEERKQKLRQSHGYSKEARKCAQCNKPAMSRQHKFCSRLCYIRYPRPPRDAKQREVFRVAAQLKFQQHPELHPNRRCAKIKESYPERMFREFIEQRGLYKDRDFYTQHKVEKYYTDFYFRSINTGVEIDGERWHRDIDREERRELVIKKYMQLKRFKASLLTKKLYEQEILNLIQAVKSAGVA